MDKSILVSVIVPVYNVENYLIECLDSIINQTYKNIEIILVNDGSTDNSRTICESYSRNDKRIIIIDQENQGLSVARNTGINYANGEYIVFIDSDDFVKTSFVELLLKACLNENTLLSICGVSLYNDGKTKKYTIYLYLKLLI